MLAGGKVVTVDETCADYARITLGITGLPKN